MTSSSGKKSIVHSLGWSFLERSGSLGAQFIVQLVLARLLLPEDYGIIAIASIFIQIADVFIQSGLCSSLIQKKDVTEKDFSSALILSFFMACIFYIIFFICAPYISNFYKEKELMLVIRVLGITLFLGAINSVQIAKITRDMNFKLLFISSFGSIVLSGVLGIITAYLGFKVWALVIQTIANKLLLALILSFMTKWKFLFSFSFKSIKSLFSYGSKILLSGLIDTVYNNLFGIIIGRTYDSKILGLYTRGDQFPKYLTIIINGSLSNVLFPAFSKIQNDKQSIKKIMKQSISMSSFIIIPIMSLMIVTARPLIILLLTNKWEGAISFLQIMCFSYIFWPIHTVNLQAIKANGYSGLYLRLEIIKKIISISFLLMLIPLGVYAMAFSIAISSLVSTFINSYPNKKLIDYGFKEQLFDILPSFGLSVFLSLVVYSISFLKINLYIIFFLQIIIFSLLYYFFAKKFKIKGYVFIRDLFLNIKNIKGE